MLVHAGQVNLKRNLDFLPSSRNGQLLDASIAALTSRTAPAEKLVALSAEMSQGPSH